MSFQFLQQAVDLIEANVRSRPSGMEFEMAYQARVAIEKIRFAIRLIEQAGGRVEQTRQVGMQLLEALERLESFERRFQQRSRIGGSRSEGR